MPLLTRIRNFLHRYYVESIRHYYTVCWGMQIGEGTRLSRTCKLDRSNPKGVVIGKYTYFTFGSVILTHDFVHRQHMTTTVGDYCFIGCGALIMPGVTIGDHCIIGANALVLQDVPSHSLVVGNPGRVVRSDLVTVAWGMAPRPGEMLPDGSPPPQPPGPRAVEDAGPSKATGATG